MGWKHCAVEGCDLCSQEGDRDHCTQGAPFLWEGLPTCSLVSVLTLGALCYFAAAKDVLGRQALGSRGLVLPLLPANCQSF